MVDRRQLDFRPSDLRSSDFLGGVGLRPVHYSYLLSQKPQICRWFEAISENFMHSNGRPLRVLEQIRHEYPVALHGVSLGIAGSDPLNIDYLHSLHGLYQRIDPFIVSDHLCWTGGNAHNVHDLLPFPLTQELLTWVVGRVDQVQSYVGRSLSFENVSSYIRFHSSDYTELEFLNELCERAGCGVLLDLNNIVVNTRNFHDDPLAELSKLNLKHVRQIHLAGFTDMGTHCFDTHSAPVFEQTWELFRWVMSQKNDIPVLLEWDESIPDFPVLEAELLKARDIWKSCLVGLNPDREFSC